MPELTSRAAAWKRAGAFETVELTRLPGLGHYPQIEDPETTYALIERHASE